VVYTPIAPRDHVRAERAMIVRGRVAGVMQDWSVWVAKVAV
jgi:hypothetical protein